MKDHGQAEAREPLFGEHRDCQWWPPCHLRLPPHIHEQQEDGRARRLQGGSTVSRQEKIEVKLLAPDEETVGTKDNPKEVTRDEDGKLVWRIDLKRPKNARSR